jgi:hypothetical protein
MHDTVRQSGEWVRKSGQQPRFDGELTIEYRFKGLGKTGLYGALG